MDIASLHGVESSHTLAYICGYARVWWIRQTRVLHVYAHRVSRSRSNYFWQEALGMSWLLRLKTKGGVFRFAGCLPAWFLFEDLDRRAS